MKPTPLTPTQRNVVARIASGETAKDIAQSMGVHPQNVKNHRFQAMVRLGIHDQIALCHWCLATGLVQNMYSADGALIAKEEQAA